MPPSHYKQLLIIPYRKHVLLTGSEVESEQAPISSILQLVMQEEWSDFKNLSG